MSTLDKLSPGAAAPQRVHTRACRPASSHPTCEEGERGGGGGRSRGRSYEEHGAQDELADGVCRKRKKDARLVLWCGTLEVSLCLSFIRALASTQTECVCACVRARVGERARAGAHALAVVGACIF
eukprot:1669455-Pleurochrysis_carterae.AAC.1